MLLLALVFVATAQTPSAGGEGTPEPALTPPEGTAADGIPKEAGGVAPIDTTEGTAQGAPPNGNAYGEPPLGNGVAPGGPVAGGTNQPTGPAPTTSSSSSTKKKSKWDDWAPFIALAGGLGLVAAVGWMWSRPKGAHAGVAEQLPAGVSVLPEAGLFGTGTPSLSNGLFLWITEGQQPDVLAPLVATLANFHRVLFVAPAGTDVPRVHGGPVFHMNNLDPDAVADAVDSLTEQGGAPLAVVIVHPNATKQDLLEFAEALPAGVGGAVLVAADVDAPLAKLTSAASPEGWLFRVDGAELAVSEGASGFVVRPA